jgi:hypothetical protein
MCQNDEHLTKQKEESFVSVHYEICNELDLTGWVEFVCEDISVSSEILKIRKRRTYRRVLQK